MGNLEAIMLILTIVLNHTLLNLPKVLIDKTKSATIINLIYISVIAIILATIIYKLLKAFPSFDILDVSNYLGGKILKTIIGCIFFTYFIISGATLLRSFCDNLQVLYYPITDITFIILLFIITLMIIGNLNLNATIRSNLFIVPIALISIIFLFIANIDHFIFERVFPLLGDGLNSTFFSGMSNLFAFGGLAYLYFIPPYLRESNKFNKVAIISIILSSIYLLLSISTIFFMFNSYSEIDEIMPLFNAVRYIEFGTFFQRLDAIFLLIWIISFMTYLSIVSKFCLDILKKLTNIKNEKLIVSPICLLILGISLALSNYSLVNFFENVLYKYLFFILVIFVNLTILIIANLKKLKEKKEENLEKQKT